MYENLKPGAETHASPLGREHRCESRQLIPSTMSRDLTDVSTWSSSAVRGWRYIGLDVNTLRRLLEYDRGAFPGMMCLARQVVWIY